MLREFGRRSAAVDSTAPRRLIGLNREPARRVPLVLFDLFRVGAGGADAHSGPPVTQRLFMYNQGQYRNRRGPEVYDQALVVRDCSWSRSAVVLRRSTR